MLYEVITVTICLIIISISFQIILKSELENTLYFKLKAELNFENLCEDIVQNIEINNSNLKTGTFDAQNYILNYTIQSYSTYEGLYIINYDCYSKNNKVLFTKKMIRITSYNVCYTKLLRPSAPQDRFR